MQLFDAFDKDGAKVRAFEEKIKAQDIEAFNLEKMDADFPNTLDLLKKIIKKGKVFKHKDRAAFFLQVISTSLNIREDRQLKCIGSSLLYSWVASGDTDSLHELFSKLSDASVSLEHEHFVNALLRDVHVRTENDMRVVPSILLLLTRTEKELELLTFIVSDAISIFIRDPQSEAETRNALLRKIKNPINKDDYETAFENLIATDAGVALLQIFQNARAVFNQPEQLASELLHTIDDKTLLRRLSERQGGNSLLVSWMADTRGVLYHLSRLDLQELVDVMVVIQPDEIASTCVKFADMLLFDVTIETDGEIKTENALGYWLALEPARVLLLTLFAESVIVVNTDEVDRVRRAVDPERYARKKNKLRLAYAQRGGPMLCVHRLEKDTLVGADAFYKEALDFIKDLTEVEEAQTPMVYILSQPHESYDNKPILELLLNHGGVISEHLEAISKGLLYKSVETNLCAIEMLLGYKEGQKCLIDFITVLPELWITMLKVDINAVFYFSGNETGRACFAQYVDKSQCIAENADVLLASFEYKDSENNLAFNDFMLMPQGSKALKALMKEVPMIFQDEPYLNRWVNLFTHVIESEELNDFTSMGCLSFTDEGCQAVAYAIKKFPEMLQNYAPQLLGGMNHVVDSWTNKSNGYSALAGFSATDAGVVVVKKFLDTCPDMVVGDLGDGFKNALVSKFELRDGTCTAMTMFLRRKAKVILYTICYQYNNFYQTYKDAIFEAGCVHPEGVVWLIEGLFSPVSADGSVSLIPFFTGGEAWFFQRALEELQKLKDPKPKYTMLWSVLIQLEEGYYNLDRFSCDSRLTSILSVLLSYKLEIPKTQKQKVLTILGEKSKSGPTVRESFRRYGQIGSDLVDKIERECKSMVNRMVDGVKDMVSRGTLVSPEAPVEGVKMRKQNSRSSIASRGSRGSRGSLRSFVTISMTSSPDEWRGFEADERNSGMLVEPDDVSTSGEGARFGHAAVGMMSSSRNSYKGKRVKSWLQNVRVEENGDEDSVLAEAEKQIEDLEDARPDDFAPANGDMPASSVFPMAELERQLAEQEDGDPSDEYIAVNGAGSNVSPVITVESEEDDSPGLSPLGTNCLSAGDFPASSSTV